MLKQFLTFGIFTFISRILGLMREILFAYTLGATVWSDLFIIAFRFPNFFRRFFAEGALHSAFIPELVASENKEQVTHQTWTIMFVFLFFFVLLVEIFAPYIAYALAAGAIQDPFYYKQAVLFIRIAFPYIMMTSLSSIMSATLSARKKFTAEASVPIILNVFMVGALLLIRYYSFENSALILICSVPIAGLFQLAYLYHMCKKAGISLKFIPIQKTKQILGMFKRMGINALSSSAMQINILIDSYLASFLPVGSISYFFYADRLNQLPLSLIGIALSSVLLPTFSAKHSPELLKKSIVMSFQVSLGAAVGLCIFSDIIIYAFFCKASLNCLMIAKILMLYSCALPAHVMSKVLNSYCYAHKKPLPPFFASLLSVATNLTGNLLLMGKYGCLGMAFATAFSAWLHFFFLFFWVMKNESLYIVYEWIKGILWSVIHGLILYQVRAHLDLSSAFLNLFYISLITPIFCASYFGLGHILKLQNFFYFREKD